MLLTLNLGMACGLTILFLLSIWRMVIKFITKNMLVPDSEYEELTEMHSPKKDVTANW